MKINHISAKNAKHIPPQVNQKVNFERKRCMRCNSTQTYIRALTRERYCRICGIVIPLSEAERKERRYPALRKIKNPHRVKTGKGFLFQKRGAASGEESRGG